MDLHDIHMVLIELIGGLAVAGISVVLRRQAKNTDLLNKMVTSVGKVETWSEQHEKRDDDRFGQLHRTLERREEDDSF